MQFARHLARKIALIVAAASLLLIGIAPVSTNVTAVPAASIAAHTATSHGARPSMFLDATSHGARPSMFLD
jgi:uncharacterized membrane protein YgaE (UPF0421/DUF939 family)